MARTEMRYGTGVIAGTLIPVTHIPVYCTIVCCVGGQSYRTLRTYAGEWL